MAWKHVRGCLTLRLGLVLLLLELLSLSRGVAAVLRVAVFLLLVSVLLAVSAIIIDARHGDDDANERTVVGDGCGCWGGAGGARWRWVARRKAAAADVRQ